MMNIYLLFLFLPLFALIAEENLVSISLQAEALWNAHDYHAASQLYEKLISHPLPHWQEARARYNLGTIYLAQHRFLDALKLFQQIDPIDLSLPQFGSNLFINEGIAYLQYAQDPSLTSFPDLQSIFIAQSLKAFDQAQNLDCQVQQSEEASSCQPSSLLRQWMNVAQHQLSHLQQKQQNQMIQANQVNRLPASILQQALDQSIFALRFSLLSEKNVYEEQHKILDLAKPFIASVLNEEDIRFHHAKDQFSSCQRSPWDQVIPLYDRGYRAAQAADSELNKTSFNTQTIIALQEQTMRDWQQALNLILHPPQQDSSASTSQKTSENIRLIQEMYLEDQPQTEQKTEELHSW